MSTSLEHLLPGPDESVRCAVHSRSIDVDPGGTALRADRVVVIATPGPWPKPATSHPLLVDAVAAFEASSIPTRVLAAHPELDELGSVLVFDRVGPTAVERVYGLPPDDPAALARLASELVAQESGSGAIASAEFLEDRHEPARPTLLICAQGTHDVCCGSEGTRLAVAVAADRDRLHRVRVARVSHTGGHRFAPTAMSLPDGRMWADLDLADVETLFTPSASLGSLVERCRGWWGADKGEAQMAERAVLALVGRSLDHLDRKISVGESESAAAGPDGASTRRCTVATPDRSWDVEVAIGREVPTIACRQPGGLPAKPGREYRVVSVTER